MPKSLVALVKTTSASEALTKLNRLLPLFSFLKKGQTVLVKPNVNTPDPYPGSTEPSMLKAIIEQLYKKGAARVLVGDMSSIVRALWRKTRQNMEKTGLAQAAEKAGAEIIAFNELAKKEWIKVRPPQAVHWPRGFTIPKILQEVDHIVNLSLIKTHWMAKHTMALKNVVGITSARDRVRLHARRGLGERIAELNLTWNPKISILDGRRVFITRGPEKGTLRQPGLVLASKDRIAADVVGVAILKTIGTIKELQQKSVWELPQIKRAVELGLGAKSAAEIKIKSFGVDEIVEIKKMIK